MPVTNFYTVEDEIIGEKTAGSPRVDYLTDALGSVTATVNQSGQVVNTYRYKPFGALLAKTGTGPDASFGWVGTQGYRPTQRKFSEHYMDARHYADTLGRWPNVDPIASEIRGLNTFAYVDNSPTTFTDPTGLQKEFLPPPRSCPLPRTTPSLPEVGIGPGTEPAACAGAGESVLFKCCARVGFIFWFLCDPLPAGPTPRPDLSCAAKHPGLPKPNAIYNEPRNIETFTGANCADASNSATSAIRRHFNYPKITPKAAPSTKGPCPGKGLHVVAQG